MKSEVLLNLTDIVKIRVVDYGRAEKPFIHADRLLDFNVFLYIISGHMKIWECGKEYVIPEKHVFFLKKGLHHYGKTEIPKGTTWYYIHFYDGGDTENGRLLTDFHSLLLQREFSEEDYNHCIPLPKLMKVGNPRHMERKLEHLIHLYKSSNVFRIAYLSYAVMEVFFDLYTQEKNQVKNDKADIITRKIAGFLENNILRSPTSVEISRHIGMNYHYISGVFRKKTGMRILEYHTKIRIHEAAALLRNSNMNISEVSDRFGFNDPLYFSHVFKKVTGYSPSEYVKQAHIRT